MIQILANDKRTLRIMLYIHWVANICSKFLVDSVGDPVVFGKREEVSWEFPIPYLTRTKR